MYCAREMGATADQAIHAHTQAVTCKEIIPLREVRIEESPLVTLTAEEMAWLRRYERMVQREVRRREKERRERAFDMLLALGTGLGLWLVLWFVLVIVLA